MKPPRKKIFLSHSSKDGALVDKLTDLLTTGCGVRADEILVTTLPGKGVPAGDDNYIEYLKNQLQQASLVILLLSENYFVSQFCLCELGASWALSIPSLPIVVPPLKKSEVKATLAVTQSGVITDSDHLDALRDIVKERLDEGLPTATWSTKRDVFLRAIPEIIQQLPAPAVVPCAALEDVRQQYEAALREIGEKDGVVQSLKSQIEDLKKCKDAEEARAVARKYSTTDETFQGLCAAAKSRLEVLKWSTRIALFWRIRNDVYRPQGAEEWSDVRDADAVREIFTEGNACYPNSDHPKVDRAETALQEVKSFLRDPKDDEFLERFEVEHDFPADIASKDFWKQFLVHV